MVLYRVQTSLQDQSALPRDQYVNSVHLLTTTFLTGAQFDAVRDTTKAFYDPLGYYMSPQIKMTGHTVKCYDLAAPLHSPPAYSGLFDFAAAPGPAQQGLPAEVAMCLTFHAAPAAGAQPQSTRGRIYIGPLGNVNPLPTAYNGGRPGGGFVDDLLGFGKTYVDAMNTHGQMVIVSRKLRRYFPIIGVAVDNSWDTQRSRGTRSTLVRSDVIVPPGGGGGTSGSW